MGIQDTLTKLGGQKGQEAGMAAIQKLVSASGGLQGITSKLNSTGMGKQVQSWIGHGDNQPISGSDVKQCVDPGALSQVAQQAGMTPDEASNHVAEVLPQMVDQATPQGKMPAEDPFSKGIGAVKSIFHH
jgi:uncharacterized protein YidB (DUF937 family)